MSSDTRYTAERAIYALKLPWDQRMMGLRVFIRRMDELAAKGITGRAAVMELIYAK